MDYQVLFTIGKLTDKEDIKNIREYIVEKYDNEYILYDFLFFSFEGKRGVAVTANDRNLITMSGDGELSLNDSQRQRLTNLVFKFLED